MTGQNRDEESQPLLEGLGEVPPGALALPGIPPELESMVLQQCGQVLHARRVRRRVTVVLASVALFAGGLWCGRQALPPAAVPDASNPVAVERRELPAEERAVPPPAPAEDPVDPRETEMLAEVDPGARQPELFRLAGDQYLTRWSDVQSALRCYRNYLELIPTEQRNEIEKQDTWLLASLRSTL